MHYNAKLETNPGHASRGRHPTGSNMTPKMHLYVLASGSKGNAAVVDGPQGSVLIDCGISRRELMRRADACGCDLDRVTHVLVTHEHSDHTRGLPALSNHFDGELLATAGTAGDAKPLASLPFTLVTHSETLELDGMVVTTFPTSHDVADPFGLRFSVLDTDGQIEDSIGWCTDTGHLTAEALGQLRGVRILGLESNHDVQMLAHGPYPAWLRARVGGDAGHLSNDQAADALPLLVTQDTETVVALHLSQKNNRPATCIRTLAQAMGATVQPDADGAPEARTPDGLLTICVASQDEPLAVW